jgi:hypothetical protein
MKYIITESQYKTIVEGRNSIKAFQNIIDNELKRIKDMCHDDDGSKDYDVCDETATIDHIIVDSIEPFQYKTTTSLIIKIYIMYNFMKHRDYTDFIYELQQTLKQSTGLPIEIQYKTTNLKTNY